MNQPDHTAIYIAVIIVALLLLNLFGVRSVSSPICDELLTSLHPLDGLEIVSQIQMFCSILLTIYSGNFLRGTEK
jgi:hypothetical protein